MYIYDFAFFLLLQHVFKVFGLWVGWGPQFANDSSINPAFWHSGALRAWFLVLWGLSGASWAGFWPSLGLVSGPLVPLWGWFLALGGPWRYSLAPLWGSSGSVSVPLTPL